MVCDLPLCSQQRVEVYLLLTFSFVLPPMGCGCVKLQTHNLPRKQIS